MQLRPLALVLIAGLSTTAAGHPNPVAQPASSHGSIDIVGPVDRNPPRMLEELAQASSDALWLADSNPNVFGYPWPDRATGQIVLSPTNAVGDGLARSWAANGARIGGPKPTTLRAPSVPVRIRAATRSVAQLERIREDAHLLVRARVRDAELIYATEPDREHNRIIISIDRMSADLLSALAARYGTEAIAVRIEPRLPARPQRHADNPAFWGGARISGGGYDCSSAFPWVDSSYYYMLSAGHCYPTGGIAVTPASRMGPVHRDSRENWNSGVGTVYLTGQSTYRGDIALIQIDTGSSGTKIYRGDKDSEYAATVKEMWWRSPEPGDQYCIGGATSGELCEFIVNRIRLNYTYYTGETVKNITEGWRGDPCHGLGDSGGPVYTVRADGGIAAKGIHSGGISTFGTCWEYFTDIWLAYWGFPGWLRTG